MITDFPGKRADEHVYMVIRKHPVVYIRLVTVFLATTLFPISIFMLIWSKNFPLSSGGNVSIFGYLGASFYILYSLVILLIAWLNEEFDLFILTNHRLIDITQVSFLKRIVATTPLGQIQDTTNEVQGFMGTLLNYGTIVVQTAAGVASDFSLDHVPDPAMVAAKILNYAQMSNGPDYVSPPVGEGYPQTFEVGPRD